ncbi:AAA family ATPase [Janthinobacterium sp. NKUCC08_JDC]|uniref:AAA family ATPase n=1 Tax=Janthinobacterium sp. NKUCC08_JDC TaxID=2842122 RepID=UPI001C5B1D78|nr:AAA family ATPase [Janthinobacterium sp. NKUCC08_JDC]MBW3500990.1 AAA family ATPase [Janthinobacterium sp. NKUCC08_JDC]
MTRITMDGVATYKFPTTLDSDKKTTLLYGLNGTGKSTLSNYLYDIEHPTYKKCSNDGLDDANILVYNTRFVKDNFHEVDSLKGIFTLSKVNKDVELKIESCANDLKDRKKNKVAIEKEIEQANNSLAVSKKTAEDVTWELKTKYSGGDRILEYCLDNLKGTKSKLFDFLAAITLTEITKNIDDLKKEAESIQGEKAQSYTALPIFLDTFFPMESDEILKLEIVGNKNSSIAKLIQKLDNADWVNSGIPYMNTLQTSSDNSCPFCQSSTVTTSLADSIKEYFDESFSHSISTLKTLRSNYARAIELLPTTLVYIESSFLQTKRQEFEAKYGQLQTVLNANILVIDKKIKSPSQEVSLVKTNDLIVSINNIINAANNEIEIHNDKIINKQTELNRIKLEFWKIARKEYDQTITPYLSQVKEINEALQKNNDALKDEISKISKLITDTEELQKDTVNVSAAIDTINKRLSDLGIDSFKIVKHTGTLYRISRNGDDVGDFHSLSEGEKTVISFVYFVELCKGKRSATDTATKKIVVIDDPISSLSHIYVFNIGRMIKKDLCESAVFDQVFIFTHSLYFFYEMTDTVHKRRKETQKLFRLVKNLQGSKIVEMSYEEIQSDYQSYWAIIKDESQPSALIANCMRNIVEYFFNFVQKRDLNNVFLADSMQDQKYQAFYRFMNRESHSVGQNIFDYKEFDYTLFQEALKLLFETSGFSEHYNAMMK